MEKHQIINILHTDSLEESFIKEGEALLLKFIKVPDTDYMYGDINHNPVVENGKTYEFWKVRFINDDWEGIRKICLEDIDI